MIKIGKEEIQMIVELIIGLGISFLIISDKLGDFSLIVWVLAIVFIFYKINKNGFDFW